MTFKNVRRSGEWRVRPKQLSRVQPLTVTQIALIVCDLHTRAHTSIYVSNFIARAINHSEMRLCARFSRVHVFLRARVLTLRDRDQLGVVRCETRNSRLLIR